MTPIKEEGSLVPEMHILNNDSGQVAIEFILTFVFALGVTFLFVSQALNMTEGYFVHYANYMASRTYLVHEVGSNDENSNFRAAEQEAKKTFDRYGLRNFGVNPTFEVETPAGIGGSSVLFTGTTAYFEKDLSSFQVIGGGAKAKLLSESFLGKEPARITCAQMICQAIMGDRGSCQGGSAGLEITLYDNGC